MVYITTEINNNLIILHCHKGSKDGAYFKLVVDKTTKEVLEKPEQPDIDASTAYSRIYNILTNHEPIPDEMVACWG
jgi:hypothetical protein